MSTVTSTPNVSLVQNVERSVYTALASGAALLIADAAKSTTGISVADWKAALVAVGAGLLTGGKNVVVNYLSSHQSLKSQVAALTAQVEAAQKPAPPAA